MMKLPILTVLCAGFCLVSCDKTEMRTIEENKPSFTKSASRVRLELREQAAERPVDFHELSDRAMRIEALDLREKALAEIAWNAMEIDPEASHEAFRRLSEGSLEKIRLIQHYALRLAEQDSDEAVEWANTLGSEREIAAAMAHVALEIAETDPLRAANLISESGIAGRDFDVVLVQVIQRWAGQSAPDAAAWVSSFPPGESRVAGIKVIMERWLPDDPSGAFGWLERIGEKSLREDAARVMQGIILQQTTDIRKTWISHANTVVQDDLERQNVHAVSDVGDNIPPEED